MDSGGNVKQVLDPVVTRGYVARQAETDEALAMLPAPSQAALRQYSIERTMGYGADYSDALELRSGVLGGEDWQSVAHELAERCILRAENAPEDAGNPTRISYFQRASALLRLSQAMMLTDTSERREIFARSAQLYRKAAELAGNCRSVLIETENGPMSGWLYEGGPDAVASTIVIGGVEGWAMDFNTLGEALAARGIDALVLDGPGQGETRFAHNHYLTMNWPASYKSAIDYLEETVPDRPIGFIGNSMGGSFAMAVAANDTRIKACCNNGGPIAPWMAPQDTTFFSKMMALADVIDKQKAVEVWSTVTPAAEGPNNNYPLLLIQGFEDPLVSNEFADMLFKGAPTGDKQMVIFSDGDHCIYRHKQDRDVLISDWMRARLTGRPWSDCKA